jgi:hypothetical protein
MQLAMPETPVMHRRSFEEEADIMQVSVRERVGGAGDTGVRSLRIAAESLFSRTLAGQGGQRAGQGGQEAGQDGQQAGQGGQEAGQSGQQAGQDGQQAGRDRQQSGQYDQQAGQAGQQAGQDRQQAGQYGQQAGQYGQSARRWRFYSGSGRRSRSAAASTAIMRGSLSFQLDQQLTGHQVHIHRQTNRQAGRQAGRQTGRQRDMQIGR